MKDKLEKQLVKDFPHVFHRDSNGMEPWSMFGIEFSDGWEPSLRRAAEKLEPLFIKAIEKDPEGYKFGYYRTSQLKEKYGTGRWYLSGGTDEMYAITNAWEKTTHKICEQCGKPGKIRGQGWYYTSCNNCSKSEDRDNLEYLENEYDKKQKKNKRRKVK